MKLITKDIEDIYAMNKHVIMFKFIPKDILKVSYSFIYHEKFSTILRLYADTATYRIGVFRR